MLERADLPKLQQAIAHTYRSKANQNPHCAMIISYKVSPIASDFLSKDIRYLGGMFTVTRQLHRMVVKGHIKFTT